MRWSWLVLIGLLLFDVWYRAHTFSPHWRGRLAVALWPSAVTQSEPLDCDEAAYAYIGHRILAGDVLYRDLTENKPPLGYWIYTLAVAIGGYNELAIRVMPIPFVLATIAIVWWIAHQIAGPVSGCMAAGLYVLFSTDPYLFGNGANLEHFINFFSIASLGLLIKGWNRPGYWPLVGSGICLGAAALVKQVALLPAVMVGPAILLRAWRGEGPWQGRTTRALRDLLAFLAGIAAVAGLAAVIVTAEGAGRPAFEDIFQYGRALATDTLPDSKAPPASVRWITGNADPSGRLPWPFGMTDYLVWWATGTWPLWLVSIPALAYLLPGRGTRTAPRRLVVAWSVAAWAQVALPGLYWQHYYLLPIAGTAIAVAVCFDDAVGALTRSGARDQAVTGAQGRPGTGTRPGKILLAIITASVLAVAMGATVFLQVRDYLLNDPEDLTARYKGGAQWVVLRAMGRDLANRSRIWDQPQLYIWGWQSPLYFYGRMDSPTRHFFVDNLLRDQADRNHWLVQPRTEEIVSTLRRRPPLLIFTGYPPFRALRTFLLERYLPSRLAPGLWVRQEDFRSFERATMSADSRSPRIQQGGPSDRQSPPR